MDELLTKYIKVRGWRKKLEVFLLITPPKSNIDTQDDGFLDASPFKHGVILVYLC